MKTQDKDRSSSFLDDPAAVLLPVELTPELFDNDEPTDAALRLYVTGGLSEEAAEAFARLARERKEVADRIERIRETLFAEREAFLPELLSRLPAAAPAPVISIEVAAARRSRLFMPREIAMAASHVPEGEVQTSNDGGTVSMAVTEVIAPGASEGALKVRVVTRRDARLRNAKGVFSVIVDGSPSASHEVVVKNWQFTKTFGFAKLQVPSEKVRYQLVLHAES